MNHFFVSKTNYAFFQTVLTGLIAIVFMVFLFLQIYRFFELYLIMLIHKIKDACDCVGMIQFFSMHSSLFWVVIFFGFGISIFIFYSLYKLIKLNFLTKKYIARYLVFSKMKYSTKLKSAIKFLGLDQKKVIEINSSDLVVFCFGFLKPKICISSMLVKILKKNEIQAVLAHEAGHMASFEPLKIFFVKYLLNIFFFFPNIKESAKKYFLFSELAADQVAKGKVAGRSGLAGAFLKIIEKETNQRLKNKASLSIFNSVNQERINCLGDDFYIPKFKFLGSSLIIGFLGLLTVSLLSIFMFIDSSKAVNMHQISQCVMPSLTQNSSVYFEK